MPVDAYPVVVTRHRREAADKDREIIIMPPFANETILPYIVKVYQSKPVIEIRFIRKAPFYR